MPMMNKDRIYGKLWSRCLLHKKEMKAFVPEKAVCPKFVSCFNESLNNVSTKKQ